MGTKARRLIAGIANLAASRDGRTVIYAQMDIKRSIFMTDNLRQRFSDHGVVRPVWPQRYIFPSTFFRLYQAVGDKEQALYWLERAYEEKDPSLFWLRFDWLSGDPNNEFCVRNHASWPCTAS